MIGLLPHNSSFDKYDCELNDLFANNEVIEVAWNDGILFLFDDHTLLHIKGTSNGMLIYEIEKGKRK